MSRTDPARNPRRLAWQRRRQALREFWAEFRTNRSGLIGLVALSVIIAIALLAPVLLDTDELSVTRATGPILDPPSLAYPLGTDDSGRSVLDLVLWGSRVSLTVGFLATLVSIAVGAVVGIVAGHFGGWLANILMRVTDWFIVVPMLVLAIALAAVLDRSTFTIIIAIGLTAWPPTARVVRAQTLAVEARPYIERARALGAGHLHIMSKHVLPNVMPLVLAQTTLLVASAIIAESTLAFLGLGDPTIVSWGGIIQDARGAGAVSAGLWWYVLPPGLAIATVALSFTLCGRSLERVLNPRLRER